MEVRRRSATWTRRQAPAGVPARFPTKKAAATALAELQHQASTGTFVAPARRTVAEYLEAWLPTAAAKESTRGTYARALRRYVVPRIGGVRLDQLNVGHLDAMYVDLSAGGLAPSTVRNQVHAPLRSALNEAVRKGYLLRNPALAATLPRAERPTMKTWSGAELDAFLGAEAEARYYPVWTVLATTGCRRGEALGLRWADLDLDAGVATIRQQVVSDDHQVRIEAGTKTGGGRQIGLDARTVSVLRAWRRTQAEERLMTGGGYRDHDLVFAKPEGEPLHPEFVSRQFSRRVQALGLPRIRLHDLRHTWASLALDAGVDVKVVSSRLGHASTLITMDLYQHVSPATDGAAAELVAGLIFRSGV